MKRFLSFLLALALLTALLPMALAATPATFIRDGSGLLSAQERSTLEQTAKQLSDKYQCSIVIVTVDDLGGLSAAVYAENYCNSNRLGYGSTSNAIVLVVSLPGRDYGYYSSGSGKQALTSKEGEALTDALPGWLGSGNYAAAFTNFVNGCGKALASAKSSGTTRLIIGIVLALALGFLLSLIPLSIMKRKNSNVGQKAAASDYVRSGSLALSVKDDRYLRTSVNRVRVASPSSDGGRAGSGGSSGSGGGKF